jgi:antitoxin (DNA-binding transcriptional repressor) of toxin-antitoxin stability system
LYNNFVETNATEFRRNLFQMMDRALRGELVEITWRGSKLRLTPPPGGSKLSRAVRRHALQVDPASIVESDSKLMAEFNRAWKRDDHAL